MDPPAINTNTSIPSKKITEYSQSTVTIQKSPTSSTTRRKKRELFGKPRYETPVSSPVKFDSNTTNEILNIVVDNKHR